MPADSGQLAARVIAWQREHGRRGLPWQGLRDPYRVWLSEIMLQQTQAATVVGYYTRFLQRFPDVAALARAPLDEVLGLWSGLGYYARARNLHCCAQQVVAEHGGQFPRSAAELARLPGIGRSTAAAIAAFCHGERQAILDGNVRRVLARVFAVDADLQRAAPLRALWERAQSLLPRDELMRSMPAYTQGLMDLGATLCTPRAPACHACPLRDLCLAAAQGRPEAYPVRRRPPVRRRQALWLLHAVDDAGRVWLGRRPNRGIWAGLHCLPGYTGEAELLAALPAEVPDVQRHPPLVHELTHRRLELSVVTARLSPGVEPGAAGAWFDASDWRTLGLPAPVRRFLDGY